MDSFDLSLSDQHLAIERLLRAQRINAAKLLRQIAGEYRLGRTYSPDELRLIIANFNGENPDGEVEISDPFATAYLTGNHPLAVALSAPTIALLEEQLKQGRQDNNRTQKMLDLVRFFARDSLASFC